MRFEDSKQTIYGSIYFHWTFPNNYPWELAEDCFKCCHYFWLLIDIYEIRRNSIIFGDIAWSIKEKAVRFPASFCNFLLHCLLLFLLDLIVKQFCFLFTAILQGCGNQVFDYSKVISLHEEDSSVISSSHVSQVRIF